MKKFLQLAAAICLMSATSLAQVPADPCDCTNGCTMVLDSVYNGNLTVPDNNKLCIGPNGVLNGNLTVAGWGTVCNQGVIWGDVTFIGINSCSAPGTHPTCDFHRFCNYGEVHWKKITPGAHTRITNRGVMRVCGNFPVPKSFLFDNDAGACLYFDGDMAGVPGAASSFRWNGSVTVKGNFTSTIANIYIEGSVRIGGNLSVQSNSIITLRDGSCLDVGGSVDLSSIGTLTGGNANLTVGNAITMCCSARLLGTMGVCINGNPATRPVVGGAPTVSANLKWCAPPITCPTHMECPWNCCTNINLSKTSTNATCGGSGGNINVTVSGGTAPYTYSWNDGPTSLNRTGLSPGSYVVKVIDKDSCEAIIGANINQTTCGPTVVVTGSPVCPGACTPLTATGTGGTPPYTYTWTPNIGSGAGPHSVCPTSTTTYTVTATDNTGATSTDTAVVTINPVATLTTAKTDVSCPGGTNGTATITPSGGTSPYTYSWVAPASGTSSIATGLSPGTYTSTVTDSKGCTVTTTVVIGQPTPVVPTTTSTPALCGQSNGSATATATGGTPAYTYAWSTAPVQNGPNATGLSQGTYTVTATDNKGCSVTTTVNVSSTGAATVTTTKTDVTCPGGSDGSATASGSGGTTPYTYAWSTVPVQNTITTTGLSAGTYTVTLTDAQGCNSTATAVILAPPPINLTTSKTDANCGGSDGSATVTASGGNGAPYTYTWTAPASGTSNTATGLSQGTYTVRVTDPRGCTKDTTISVGDVGSPTFTVSSTNNVCFGDSAGTITSTVSGGVPPYTYTWTPATLSGPNATGLKAGTYTLVVTGNNNCSVTRVVVITEPTALGTTTSKTDANCGASDGGACVTVTGGTPPYTYAWSPSGGAAACASSLSSGAYTVTVRDNNGCTISAVVNVNDIGAPTATTNGTNVRCKNGTDGTATVTVNGGQSPYTYSWNTVPAQNTTSISNLSIGTYVVTVTASNGCKTSTNIVITEPNPITLSTAKADESCSMSNGSATVTATGGTGAFTYSWTPIGGSNNIATGLSAGSYTVLVTDNNGCTNTTTTSLGNTPGPTPDFSAPPRCIGDPTPFTDASTNPSLWGWDFGDGSTGSTQNPTHTYLTAGTFNVTLVVTDSKGCTASVTKPVVVNPLPNVNFTDSLTGCSPLPVTFTNLSDPGSYLWNLGNGTTTLINPSTTYTNTTASPVSYTITLRVISAAGCTATLTKPNYITVYPNPIAEFTMNPTETEILFPDINFYDQSIGNPVSWFWTFGDGDSSTVQNPKHTYRDTGTYTVCLTIENAYSCPSTICHPVVIKPIWTFYIPNAFTPDGDGTNDFFNGKGYNITEYQLWIFDRWGDLIYTTGITHDPGSSVPWDGRANGGVDPAQEDVYVWVVKLKDVFDKKHRYVGSVTLVR